MILVVAEAATMKEVDIKLFFEKFHQLYASVTSNPFYEANTAIASPRFESEMSELSARSLTTSSLGGNGL
jgi:hypothetical protein